MTQPAFVPVTGPLAALDLLRIETAGAIGHVRLNRPAKRNAVNDALIAQLHSAFVQWPDGVRAVVLSGEGAHFCAGLDLSELSERSVAEGILHSRSWHAAMDAIQFGKVPVVAVLHGAVVGGGLEIASSCHIRVAEQSAYYGLPEGQRGIFVGGGGSARVPRLAGVACMTFAPLRARSVASRCGSAACSRVATTVRAPSVSGRNSYRTVMSKAMVVTASSVSSARSPGASAIEPRKLPTPPWRTITPLGRPVDPEV